MSKGLIVMALVLALVAFLGCATKSEYRSSDYESESVYTEIAQPAPVDSNLPPVVLDATAAGVRVRAGSDWTYTEQSNSDTLTRSDSTMYVGLSMFPKNAGETVNESLLQEFLDDLWEVFDDVEQTDISTFSFKGRQAGMIQYNGYYYDEDYDYVSVGRIYIVDMGAKGLLVIDVESEDYDWDASIGSAVEVINNLEFTD